MLNTEAGPKSKTPYCPTEAEESAVKLSLFCDSIGSFFTGIGSRMRQKPASTLSTLGGLSAAGSAVYLSAASDYSAYVEAVPQNSTRDDILNKISIPPLPELPQISTPVATPVPNSIGGRGFRIGELAPGTIKSEWQAGTNMSLRYRIIRYSAQGPILLPVPGMIMPEVTTYTDTPPGTPACYLLIAQDGQNIIANSDLVCLLLDSRLGLFPQELNIRLDQSDTARLSWKNPGNITDYQLQVFGSNPGIFPVSGSSTETTLQTGGQPACAVLIPRQNGVNVGLSEVLCAIPRVSKFSNPELTPTPNVSPTPTQFPYYTQIRTLLGEGTVVKAGPLVQSNALQIVIDKAVSWTSYRQDLKNRCIQNRIEVAIIPNGQSINTLPEPGFKNADSGLRGLMFGNIVAIAEENIRQLPTDWFTQQGIDSFAHEFTHLMYFYCFTDIEKNDWDNKIYPRLASQPNFPNNWAGLAPNFFPIYTSKVEANGDIGRLWLKGLSTQIRAIDDGTGTYWQSIYGPR